MTQALSVIKNSYWKNPKNSTVYTPPEVSDFLYRIISSVLSPRIILDPAIGRGALTAPWRVKSNADIIGIDIDPASKDYADQFLCTKFEDVSVWNLPRPELILCNSPFNGARRRTLYPEVFLRKIVDLFGTDIPIVLFAPMGFRLNQLITSKRWQWLRDTQMDISSIISLPINIFPGVKFHTEILLFNIPGLKPHYFLDEKACLGSSGRGAAFPQYL
jgi:hypothetical protein